QLWNVLRGDMGLVGPRPAAPAQLGDYTAEQRRIRASVRPGITGLAQVSGRSSLGNEDSVAFDLWYATHASVGTDLRILVRTGGARRLFVSMIVVVGAATGLVALAAAVGAPLFVRVLGPGLAEGTAARAVPLFALAAAVFPLTALAAVTTGYLQANGRFGVPA